MLKAGIVGLPNVGKSTLFNALTRSRKATAENYPFCTIDPNVGVVEVPDVRLAPLADIVRTQTIIPAAVEIVDIAGLVAGASKGDGLGNKFLANIREVDAIVHVVRCFEDDDIVHNMGTVDPIRDIDVIITELILADIESAQAQLGKNEKKARGQDKEAIANVAQLKHVLEHLNQNKPAITLALDEDDKLRLAQFCLLSAKPILYACNVGEDDLALADTNDYVQRVRQHVAAHHEAESCVICSKLEAELGEIDVAEAKEYLHTLGVKNSGVSELIRATYGLLGLASYFTKIPNP